MRLRAHLATLPPSRVWAVLKFLAGAWTTSHRMHVIPDKRGCHFGCTTEGGNDEIGHYAVCPRMWHQLALPRGQLSGELMTRIGLMPTSDNAVGENGIPSAAARMAVASRTYHMTKYGVVPMSYERQRTAFAAARRALRLPADLAGGAGTPRASPTFRPPPSLPTSTSRSCPTDPALLLRPQNHGNIGRSAALRAGPPRG